MRRAIYIWFTMVLLLLITVGDLSAQNQHSGERLHRKSLLQNTERHLLAFYNVENLFDTLNSPTTVDEDMLPLADREWNGERLSRKIDLIARVITDMRYDGQLPAIMALAEVENRQVLEHLCSYSALQDADYQICHSDSPDRRGIDVALLYRPELFKPQGMRALPITIADMPYFTTRDILAVWGEFCGEQFLFIVVHWPSRIGGVWQTEHLRIACAQKVRSMVDSAMQRNPKIKIVVAGDMNDNPLNRSLRCELRTRHSHRRLQSHDLYNPFVRKSTSGSSRYDGRWNHYDNIIISANLVCGESQGLKFDGKARRNRSAYIFRRDYMCDAHGYPRPTYRGVEYVGGVSDHLPVCLLLQR